MKKYLILCSLLSVLCPAAAEKILLTPAQVVAAAHELIAQKDFSGATSVLVAAQFDTEEYETERLYLLAKIAAAENRPEDAIVILRFILDHNPDLPKVRLELGLAYLAAAEWSRADYHLRLAAAAPDIPPAAMDVIRFGLFAARQNKNWNAWLNIGAAPEDNVNAAAGGEECIHYLDGFGEFPYPLCRKLPRPERALGFNVSFGGDYELRMSDNWRWKTDAAVMANFYDLTQYNNSLISVGTGPRYIFGPGDTWLAAAGSFMSYGNEPYKKSAGLRAESNYDFTRRLSVGFSADFMKNDYFGAYRDFMNGDSYSAAARAVYYITPNIYLVAKGGAAREDALEPAYANWAKNAALGIGSELWFGFRAYAEAGRIWTDYDGERYVVRDRTWRPVVEHSALSRYILSLSNNKIDLYGFTPMLQLSWTQKDSNIKSREYGKTGIGITMQKRF